MKRLITILTLVCIPQIASLAYLAVIGDISYLQAFFTIFSLPGELVLSVI